MSMTVAAELHFPSMLTYPVAALPAFPGNSL